jgi:hypothetical protein
MEGAIQAGKRIHVYEDLKVTFMNNQVTDV